jgi:hypothetical protein
MRHPFAPVVLVGSAFLASSPAPRAAVALERPLAGAAWRQDAVWDDGKAEFSVYEVDWPRYGASHRGRALLVLVKEPWAPELDVKADRPRADGFDVLKLNHVRRVPTGIYTYEQASSLYFRRDDGGLRKLVATSFEACGISTAHLRGGRLETRSYFDGQGDRSLAWPAGAVPEDGLPAALRDFVAGQAPPALAVFPSLMASRFPPLAARAYRVARREVGEIEVPAGRFAAVELRLEGQDGALVYRFAALPPHPLLFLRHADGTEYRLVKSERLAYWQMHAPGDERWLPEGLR